MKNGYSLLWTENAKSELSEIINYIATEWNEVAVRKFAKKLETALESILTMPTASPESSSKKNIRRKVINKQTSIYYKILNDEIVILSIFDNRRDNANYK